jgi:hypothetical protein
MYSQINDVGICSYNRFGGENPRFNQTDRMNMCDHSAVGPVVMPRLLQSWLRVVLKISGAFVLAVAGAVFIGFTAWGYSEAIRLDQTGAIESLFPMEFVAPWQSVWIQPRAWEFAPPHEPDLLPDRAARSINSITH